MGGGGGSPRVLSLREDISGGGMLVAKDPPGGLCWKHAFAAKQDTRTRKRVWYMLQLVTKEVVVQVVPSIFLLTWSSLPRRRREDALPLRLSESGMISTGRSVAVAEPLEANVATIIPPDGWTLVDVR